MFRFFVILAVVASAVAFRGMVPRMTMKSESIQAKIGKAVGVAAMGFALAGPVQIVNADGAVSISTIYRARTSYGAKIVDAEDAVQKGDFATLGSKKLQNAFDLFISGGNAKSTVGKATAKKEKDLEAAFFAAVKAKDAAKVKSVYSEFIKVADLKSEYKPGEPGQTDSSGYSPTWGTARQQIYQR
jgi:Photosystem II Psb31 protein